MNFPQTSELEVMRVGPCTVPSPLEKNGVRFVDEQRRVLLCSDTVQLNELKHSDHPLPSFEPAGPREQIYYDPRDLACGIVTCGGLCPGNGVLYR